MTAAARAKAYGRQDGPEDDLDTTFSRSAATETDSSRGICAWTP